MEYTSKRREGISLACLNVIMSQLGEQKENLWQGPALSHWCTWSPGQGVHSLFVGMLRNQKNMKFEEFTIQLFYERGFNFHSILSKSIFLLYLFIKDLVHIVVLKWYICVV